MIFFIPLHLKNKKISMRLEVVALTKNKNINNYLEYCEYHILYAINEQNNTPDKQVLKTSESFV